MHHPRRETCATPDLRRGLTACFVERLDRDDVLVAHELKGAFNQTASDTLTPEGFVDVEGINNSKLARLDNGRDRFPHAHATDEKTGVEATIFCDETECARFV